MAWDFSTEPEFQEKLDWIGGFVREKCEPLDLVWPGRVYEPPTPEVRAVIDPLKDEVRRRGLWACHLGPELGGQGYGAVKLALMNELLGRSHWAPLIFGTQAPDTGNAEILARFGTEAQKERYLRPLLDGELFSCYSMTEPQAGADPSLFITRAWRDGDDWVIDGRKFFSSNARTAAFLIVMAVTDPEAPLTERMSMFLVPTDTPGINILRNIGLMSDTLDDGKHALIHYDKVRVGGDALLGGVGQAFAIAQARLGGGRIHHAMRTIGVCSRALDMLCERALSRRTADGRLADKQAVQFYIAESWTQLMQFRLLVLYTAWLIDQRDTRGARREIAAVKAITPQVQHDIVQKAIQVHGALGVSNEMPLGRMWMQVPVMAIVDGPTEVHKVTVARQVLRDYSPAEGEWPTEHVPERLAAAREMLAEQIEHVVANS